MSLLHDLDHDVPLGAFEQYMREVKQTAHLTGDEEGQLLLCIANGVDTERACDRLIRSYQPLMISLAKHFARHCNDMEQLDFVQEGNEAFLKGMQKYNPYQGDASFGTFIFSWVRVAMLTALWRNRGMIRLPLHKVRAMKRLRTVYDELYILLQREPTITELATNMELSEWDTRELLALQEQQVISLDTVIGDDDDMSPEEVIEDPDASAFTDEDMSSIEDMLEHLTEQERVIIQARYGFGDEQAHTQQEVALALGMRLNRVQELDRRARFRLRRILEHQAC
jgi:RNA polymerase sigma factor (sigma-70 family)